jgi:hypothetical protein
MNNSSFSKLSEQEYISHQLIVSAIEAELRNVFPHAKIVTEAELVFLSHLARKPEEYYPDIIVGPVRIH